MIIRENYLNKLIEYKDSEFIKVITGVRRSGKSFLLQMYKEYLETNFKSASIIYLNFEHPDNFSLNNWESLYKYIQENAEEDKKVYFLFDEIQEVENWQKLINGLRVKYDCDIYITGSNASILSGELATYLTGRYVEIKVYPLSFNEFLDFKDYSDSKELDNCFDEYIKYGGFPSVVLANSISLKNDALKGIYNSIIFKDVALRSGIKDSDLLLRVSSFLMGNIGQPVSSNNISNYLSSNERKSSVDTIEKYLELLNDSFIFYKSTRYDIRGKEKLKTLGKYYCVDVGIRNSVLGRTDSDRGSQIENLVYLKLIQSGYEVFVGKYNEFEIDFVCFREDKIKYIQVAYEIPDLDNREVENLLKIKDNYEQVIVTANRMQVGWISGIKVVHLIDFLLEEQ